MSNHREQRKRSTIAYRDSSEDEIDVLTPSSEASSDYTDGESDEVSILSTKEPNPVVVTIVPYKQQPPYHRTRNVDTIYAYLEKRVKDQPTLYNIAATISAAINRSFTEQQPQEDRRPKVTKLMIAGVSGCGKTETVLATQALLGIGPGTDCEAQVVFLDGSTLCSESQVNAITGAAAGLVGYRDGHSIADRLNRAINKPTNNKKKLTPFQQQAAIANAATTRTKPKKVTATPEAPYVPPRFIMLVIDELDKVSPDLLKAINGLIETGDYATPNNSVCFKKPVETTLFIMFTCNYGAEAIGAMKERNDEVAEGFVVQDMRACGVPPYTIGRLGDIYAFYPLEREPLQRLLSVQLIEHIINTPLAKKLAKRINVHDEADMMLVNHVMAKIQSDLGMRGAMKQLLRRVDLLFEKAFAVLNEGGGGDEDGNLCLTGHRFNARIILGDHPDHEEAHIIRSIKANQANRQALALCRGEEASSPEVEVLGISLGDVPLCHFIMPFTSNVVIATTTTPNNTTTVLLEGELLARNQTLATISRMVNDPMAVSHSSAMMKHIRELVNNSSVTPQKQEATAIAPHRVLCITNGESEPANKRKREVDHSLALNKGRRGCKAREIDGFTAIEYLPTAKRYLYECNDCAQSVDSRKIGTHQCII